MYINYCDYLPLVQRELGKTPRDRYITYFQDLYRISDKTLSAESFRMGDQYSYTDIIEAVLETELPFSEFPAVSDVVFSYWTPEWDPEHSAFAPYFLWKAQLDAEIFDVCDVGSIATTTALHILSNTDSLEDQRIKVLVGMEQTSIPRNLSDCNLVPERSSGSVMFISNACTHKALFKVEDSVYLNENIHYSEPFALASRIKDLFAKHKLAASDCQLILQRGTSAFKQIDYLTDKQDIDQALLTNAHFLANDYSVNKLPQLISSYARQSESRDPRWWLYIDEDAESLNTTLTLMRPL